MTNLFPSAHLIRLCIKLKEPGKRIKTQQLDSFQVFFNEAVRLDQFQDLFVMFDFSPQ